MGFWITLFQCIADECLYDGGFIDQPKHDAILLPRTYSGKLATLPAVDKKETSWYFFAGFI